MKTKICTKCKVEKPLSEFHFRKDNNKYRNECKQCQNLKAKQYQLLNKTTLKVKNKAYRKNFPWLVTFRSINQRCNKIKNKAYGRYGGRGIKCLITKEEIKQLWYRDKAYLMKKPSIDRIDNDGHYIFENCRFIELKENVIKGNKETHCKKILQFDKQGNFIREWESITKASKGLKCNIDTLSQCLRGKSKTSVGFIWKYKNV